MMGRAVLQGISTALLVTVLTLAAGIFWTSTDLGVVSVSQLVDIGLLASCLTGGYRTGKQTGYWFFGTLVGVGFVTIGSLLLALFTPIRGIGFLQVLLIGALLGSVAGAFGAGNLYRNIKQNFRGVRRGPAYSAWSEYDNWQNVDEVEDSGFKGDSPRQGSSEESLFLQDGSKTKRYTGQHSSPWWEEEIMHNS